jgi:hypothetical protein
MLQSKMSATLEPAFNQAPDYGSVDHSTNTRREQRKPFSHQTHAPPLIQYSFDAKTSTEPVTSHMPLCAGYGALGVELRHQLRVIADTGKLRHNAKVLRNPEGGGKSVSRL